MTAAPAAERVPPNGALIEVHVADLMALFNSFDPTPFHKRDLDPDAEAFITSWARDLPPTRPLALVVHADQQAVPDEDIEDARRAVRDHFARRAGDTRRKLRLLFRNGRIALVIGLTVVAGSVIVGDLIENMLGERRIGSVIRESFLIGGWVAMWRPLEIFLYDWWPVRAEARLFDRLSAMTVQVRPHRHT